VPSAWVEPSGALVPPLVVAAGQEAYAAPNNLLMISLGLSIPPLFHGRLSVGGKGVAADELHIRPDSNYRALALLQRFPAGGGSCCSTSLFLLSE
jgi:hypothetical protein